MKDDKIVHFIKDGKAVTECCGKSPFELPLDDRITVKEELKTCKG